VDPDWKFAMACSLRTLIVVLLLPWFAFAREPDTGAAPGGQFTFAWPLGEHALKPAERARVARR